MAEQTLEARAVARYIQMSPYKVRRVVNVVRGMPVEQAVATLRLMPHRAAKPVRKVIESAAANAEENLGLSRRAPFRRAWSFQAHFEAKQSHFGCAA